MSLSLIEPPEEEPVGLADLKLHLRLDGDAENEALAGFIRAARRAVEARGGLSLVEQKWRLVFDRPPARPFALPRSPLVRVDAVEWRGGDGAWRALEGDLYTVDAGPPARLGASGPWPAAPAFRVDFVVGWPSAGAVPEELRLAVRMLAGHFYENREGAAAERIFAVPLAVDALVAPHRQVRL